MWVRRALTAASFAGLWARLLPGAPPPALRGGGGRPPLDDEAYALYLVAAGALVVVAGLMSGLTLGLMSLDAVDLEVLSRSGTPAQRAAAARIRPALAAPHRLLVTLLAVNAAAAEALPLVLDRLTDPVTAVALSVTVVLLFGEIVPQAASAAYGLEMGAAAAPLVRALMFLTAPLNVPVAWLLDRVLGARGGAAGGALFRRAELKALVDIHGEGGGGGGGGAGGGGPPGGGGERLSPDEVRIIKGALDLTGKTAGQAMTPLDVAFMLPLDAALDAACLTAVLASGHSRVPVHAPGDRLDVRGLLLVKELVLVDPAAGTRVRDMKVRPMPALLADTPLYDVMKLFERGRSHMAVLTAPTPAAAAARAAAAEADEAIDVFSLADSESGEDEEEEEAEAEQQRAWEDGGVGADAPLLGGGGGGGGRRRRRAAAGPAVHPPRSRSPGAAFSTRELAPVGIITIEDAIEELLGVEIVDETDRFVDNLRRQRVEAAALARLLPPHLRASLRAARGLSGADEPPAPRGGGGGGAAGRRSTGGGGGGGGDPFRDLPRALMPGPARTSSGAGGGRQRGFQLAEQLRRRMSAGGGAGEGGGGAGSRPPSARRRREEEDGRERLDLAESGLRPEIEEEAGARSPA